jgi:hypothetical protein
MKKLVGGIRDFYSDPLINYYLYIISIDFYVANIFKQIFWQRFFNNQSLKIFCRYQLEIPIGITGWVENTE